MVKEMRGARPFILKDRHMDYNTEVRGWLGYDALQSLALSFNGYGDATSQPGYGIPIVVEVYEGELRLLVWADINQENPTHIISLEGAREELYEGEESD